MKLTPPVLGAPKVDRLRVQGLLDVAADVPVTLLVAPPGAGKSVAVSSWSGTRQNPVGWLSLDADDNDPRRLWSHVLAALRTCVADQPEHPLHALAAPAETSTEFLTLVVNTLTGAAAVTLVLDDLHLLRGTALDTIGFLVEHQPDALRLVLSTRADPPLHLQRLRLAGRLAEIRARDLAFTPDEAGELFAAHDLDLTAAQVGILLDRTEGWVTGLRLSAMSLSAGADPDTFLRAFSGTDYHVAEYLVSEFLAVLPEAESRMLLRLSVCRDVSVGLAGALCPDAEPDLLRDVARRNAFVTPVGERADVYRIHHLVGQLLNAELRLCHPEQVAELHRRAAQYLRHAGDPLRAARHAVAAEDPELAAEVLAQGASRLFLTGSGEALRRLATALPPHLVHERPDLAAAVAGTALAAGDSRTADELLHRVRNAGPPGDGIGTAPVESAFTAGVGLLATQWDGDLEDGLTQVDRLLEARAVGGRDDALSLFAAGVTELWTGRIEDARAHLDAALVAADADGLEHLKLRCLAELTVLDTTVGELDRALARGGSAVAFARLRGWSDDPYLAGALVGSAWVHHLRGDDERAAEAARSGAALAARGRSQPALLAADLVGARVRQAEGRSREGLATLADAADGRRDWRAPSYLSRWLGWTEADLLASCGEFEEARGRLLASIGDRPWMTAEAAVSVRLHLLEGDAATADRELRRWTPLSAAPAAPWTRVTLLLLDAVTGATMRRPDREFASLDRALSIAAPEGLIRPFLQLAPLVGSLLHRHRVALVRHRTVLDAVLHALADEPPTAPTAPTPEALTPREHSFLPYLATMLTQEEISACLHISLNTTRTHIRALYRKLGVSSRRDAVHRARELELL